MYEIKSEIKKQKKQVGSRYIFSAIVIEKIKFRAKKKIHPKENEHNKDHEITKQYVQRSIGKYETRAPLNIGSMNQKTTLS